MSNTINEIKERMLDNIPSEFDKSEGSFFYDAIAPAAIELALAYTKAEEVLALAFAESSNGLYLDYRAHEHGLARKPAVKAKSQITITGSEGSVIPIGSLFASGAGVMFQTVTEVEISSVGKALADIEAYEAGAAGNVPAQAISNIPVTIVGVQSVINENPTSGGVDIETDAALLERLLAKVRQPATSGNTYHYRQWALEVAGVGDARVQPLWNGNGTVRIIIIDTNKQPVTAEVIQNVADYIETVRPIGASVTVNSAVGLRLDVAADVNLASDAVMETVKTAVEYALINCLKEIAFKQNYVSYARLGAIILDTPGVLDYSNLTLNTGTANMSVDDTEVAILGTVTLS